ncbi:MAG: Snf7 family protein [Candidatus Verstraetearchaeota archaeon]|nr:Snf7 family protein [Candidatus Verstraetearchaeota archaeon]
MPDNISDKWQAQEKGSAAEKIREQIVPPPPMSQRLETAKRKLREQIVHLDRISERLSARDKDLYEKMVKAYGEHDSERAKLLANELAELRKMEQKTHYGKYALERAYTRIEMAKDYGDMVAALVPVGQVVKSVRGTLGEFFPSSSAALDELSGIMNETIVSFSNITGSSIISGGMSEDAEMILKEAAAVAESRLKDKLPGAGTDQPLPE